MPAAARWWLISAYRSCASRVIPFSFAIRSADWPMVSPVDGSAMAGATGTRSRGRTEANSRTRSPMERALLAATSTWLKRLECRMGMSDRLSTPPAITTSACPT